MICVKKLSAVCFGCLKRNPDEHRLARSSNSDCICQHYSKNVASWPRCTCEYRGRDITTTVAASTHKNCREKFGGKKKNEREKLVKTNWTAIEDFFFRFFILFYFFISFFISFLLLKRITKFMKKTSRKMKRSLIKFETSRRVRSL